MNESVKVRLLNNNLNWKSILDRLSAAMMLPLSFLAFTCIFLGVAYILPSNWLIVISVKTLVGILFSLFPLFVFMSIVNTFINDKNSRTMIEALVFIFTIIAILLSIDIYFEIGTSFSIFTAMISAVVFINLYRYNIYSFGWVGIATLLYIVLGPIFIIVDLLIKLIGSIINILPFGLNAFFYGFFNRLLIPIGLHSVMIPTFAWSPVGGYLELYDSTGEVAHMISGDSPIWLFMYTNQIKDFALQGSVNIDGANYTYQVFNNKVIGQYQQGFLPITAFTFPLVALVYCLYNDFEKGKMILTGAILTAFSGITETMEFNYILLSPWMYLLNATMVGLSFMLCNIFHVNNWLSTGWGIDIILFGFIPWIKGYQTNWYVIPIIGLSIGALYSLLFIYIDNRFKVIIK